MDTRSKRASSAGLLLAFLLHPVLPDGTIAQGDRQHAAATYSGIAAATAGDPFAVVTVTDAVVTALTLTDAVVTVTAVSDAAVTVVTVSDAAAGG